MNLRLKGLELLELGSISYISFTYGSIILPTCVNAPCCGCFLLLAAAAVLIVEVIAKCCRRDQLYNTQPDGQTVPLGSPKMWTRWPDSWDPSPRLYGSNA